MKLPLASRRLFYLCLSKLKRNSNPKNVEIFFDSKDEIIITVEEYMECGVAFDESYRQMIVGAKHLVGYVCTVNADIFYSNPENKLNIKNQDAPKNERLPLHRMLNINTVLPKWLYGCLMRLGFSLRSLPMNLPVKC